MNRSIEHLPIETALGNDGEVVIFGAGGSVGTKLYIPKLVGLGLPAHRILAIEPHDGRRSALQESYPDINAFSEPEQAFSTQNDRPRPVRKVIIASSTAAHIANLKSITGAIDRGWVRSTDMQVWSEKPMSDPDDFSEVHRLVLEHDLDVSVGYILRYSRILPWLHAYMGRNGLTVESIEWKYGKDRTSDSRPSQGVLADELVHPLSVTDYILRADGDYDRPVQVRSAHIQRRPYVNLQAQAEARRRNPETPLRPISDVDTVLGYHIAGLVLPVTVSSSFLFPEEVRKAVISTCDRSDNKWQLSVEFDVREFDDEGCERRVDILRGPDNSELHRWSGDKAMLQMIHFLGLLTTQDAVPPRTSFVGECALQQVLADIAKKE